MASFNIPRITCNVLAASLVLIKKSMIDYVAGINIVFNTRYRRSHVSASRDVIFQSAELRIEYKLR